MNKVFRKLQTAWNLPRQEKTWLLLLYPLSGFLIRGAMLAFPFRLLAAFLGRHHGNIQLSPVASPEQLELARRIGCMCRLLERFTPWESKCLVQATLAKILLSYYGIPYALYLGVTKPSGRGPQPKAEPGMKAHAWVAVGPKIVTGRDGHRAFTVVSTFVSPALLSPLERLELARTAP